MRIILAILLYRAILTHSVFTYKNHKNKIITGIPLHVAVRIFARLPVLPVAGPVFRCPCKSLWLSATTSRI